MGLESGLYCAGPLSNSGVFNEPIENDNYSCIRDEIANWEEYWYSPICRDWYKDQKTRYNSNPETLRGIIDGIY
jgi:hypothetical protein